MRGDIPVYQSSALQKMSDPEQASGSESIVSQSVWLLLSSRCLTAVQIKQIEKVLGCSASVEAKD